MQTFSEFVAKLPLKPKTQWGPWKAKKSRLVLVWEGSDIYEVEFSRLDSPEEVLDWLYHFAEKSDPESPGPWTPECLGWFLMALRDLGFVGPNV